MSIGSRRLWLVAVLLLGLAPSAFAQRELRWDDLTVTAHLAADGSLHVTEEQTMVFSGDWNGGERTFNIRPRQTLSFEGMSRWTGNTWEDMVEGASLANVQHYAFTDAKTLRWRSRLPSDPPFNRTAIRYQLRYTLSNILLMDGDRYTLSHDFAFSDRVGPIDRFELHLTLDPAWQPLSEVRERYTANGLAPGRSFELTIPLRYVGAGTPAVFDQSRPPEVQIAVLAILGLTLLSVLWVFASEQAKGRFSSIDMRGVDETWLREHILKFPAELVSAAWDDSIGQAEVVTLLARMTAEGKLESQIAGEGSHSRMTLHLKVDRGTLTGYERKLVDALFYDNRTTTSTDEVKSHYHKTGFNPVSIIQSDLAAALKTTFPFADASKVYGFETFFFYVCGLGLLVTAWLVGDLPGVAVFLLFIGSAVLAGLASIGGMGFRQHMDRGPRVALLSLIPPLAIAGATAAFVWYYVGTDRISLSTVTLSAVVAMALGATNTSINALRSRQRREGVAFRKQLTAGRLFFMSELRKPQPALRDAWYPWLLAFELEKAMNDWSASSPDIQHSHGTTFTSSSGSSSSSSASSWTGFGGGRSGGAGAGATWAAAAGGLAAGVAAPSSGGSGGGGGGGGGGSSSGGGGGGGW